MRLGRFIFAAAALLTASFHAGAQMRLDWNVDMETLFDNREYDGGGNLYTNSMTVFGARIHPEVGFRTHDQQVMLGIDISKDFGSKESIGDLFKELTLYYSLEKRVSPRCIFSLDAGIFPRTKGRGYYSEAFYSDSLKFYDPNYEGLLMMWQRPKSYYELGVDWKGQIGHENRERFVVFSAGQSDLLPWMRLGYSFYMYHYANSLEVRGVVDNMLINPYIRFDVAPYVPLQELSFKLGYLQAAQQDRMMEHRFRLPQGGEFVAVARKWNVSIRNTFYFGRDLMPLYNSKDLGGYKYGNELYMGEPFYRVRPNLEAADSPAVYDRLEAFWEPHIVPGLWFRVGAAADFNAGFSGWRQIIGVRFDMNELKNKR